MALPTILLLAPPDDGHVLVVQRRLEELATSAQVVVIDTGAFPQHIAMEIRLTAQQYQAVLHLPNQQKISGDTIRSIWFRRPRIPQIDAGITDAKSREFAFRESFHALKGLWQNTECFWLNHPLHDRAAAKKVHQLKIAQKIGLRVPDTLITNAPQAVRQFWEEHHGNIIYKQLRGVHEKLVQTALVSERELALLENIRLAPVIFQECIAGVSDLRITVIGHEIFPAMIKSQDCLTPLDWRWDLDVPMEKCTIPDALANQIHGLMQELGLLYGAIDMKMTKDGEYVFFEINPSGQFLFVEIQAGWPLSTTLARMLVEGKA